MPSKRSVRRAVSPRKKPVQERSQATLDAILTAAARVFEARGYAHGTTNHIAREAGVSIGSLYEYFPSKDAILIALARQHMAEGFALLQTMLDPTELARKPLPTFLRRVIHAMVRLHTQNPRLHRVLFEETPLPGIFRREIETGESVLREAVKALLTARADVTMRDPSLTAYFVVHLVEAMTHGYVLHPPADCDEARFVEEATTVLERYLALA